MVYLNGEAEAAIQKGDTLQLSNGRLTAALPEERNIFERLLAEATGAAPGLCAGGSILMHGRLEKNALSVTAVPFVSSFTSSLFAVVTLLFLSDPSRNPLKRSVIMRALYGLTPTEARLADLLLCGSDIREAAMQLKISLETGRYYVKQILNKTKVRRQAELIRLMMSCPEACDR